VLAEQEREEGVGEGAVRISLVGRVEEGAEEAVVEREAAPVLILHVKGFCYDTVVGGAVKVGRRVAFGPELEVGNDSRTSLLEFSFDAGSALMCAWYVDVMGPTARKQAM
jgi:hypothetical protein